MVDFVGIERVRELVARTGPAAFTRALGDEIEADFLRWEEFDKSPRHAVHSKVGVIELMPISDGKLYSFKYVNGHPKNTAEGLLTVTAFGVLADVDTGYPILLSELTLTTAGTYKIYMGARSSPYPSWSQWTDGGLPFGKLSSTTHCINGSHATGQVSSIPYRSLRVSISDCAVAGVILSTMLFGKVM